MNTYEFWNDMDKIFDAIVAYQEKTIEFNKQFVNPWIKLGKVFDKQETDETIVAHKNAVEIDPENPQNWHQLANAYARTRNFERAILAYQKSIELGFESGELYKNLALAQVMTGQYQASIATFQKSLELLEQDEEKAIVWNHLGNVFRKVDNYEMALQAFQQADQFEHQTQAETEVDPEYMTEDAVTPAKEVDASQPTEEPASVIENVSAPEDVVDAPDDEENLEVELNEQQEEVEEYNDEAEEDDEDDNEMPVILELDFSKDSLDTMVEAANFSDEQPVENLLSAPENEVEVPLSADMTDEKLEIEVQDTAEVSLETTTVAEQTPEPLYQVLDADDDDEDNQAAEQEKEMSFVTLQESAALNEDEITDETDGTFEEDADVEDEEFDALEDDAEVTPVQTAVSLAENQPADEVLEESVDLDELEDEPEISRQTETAPAFSAYEEYLKDNSDPVTDSEAEESQTTTMTPAEVEATYSEALMDANTDLTVDMDTKNAHVWNELGNVYFNAGSFDDAIAAYSKAIELDKQFAWPYTNLALSYVQKGRLEEAVSLYQRSIELFSNENDKAVTWNRLGNVYRRLNDYENAIAAYQCADELDPGSVATNQQAKFSLLGSEKVNQELSYSV